METKFYTFILDYIGGTYISQVRALSPKEALRVWIDTVDLTQILGIGEKSRKKIQDSLDEYALAPLTGLYGAWSTSYIVMGKLALVNCIQTDMDTIPPENR